MTVGNDPELPVTRRLISLTHSRGSRGAGCAGMMHRGPGGSRGVGNPLRVIPLLWEILDQGGVSWVG